MIIFGQIWKERCRRVSGEGKLHSYSLFVRICSILRYQVKTITPKVLDDDMGKAFLSFLQIECLGSISLKCFWVKWSCPAEGFMKLNTDGASRGNPGLAGGGQ